jgi:hypothetical protein
MPAPIVNLVEFPHALDLLDRLASKASVDRALQSAGLSRELVDRESGFLPYLVEAQVLEHVARALGDADLGARLAQHFDYAVYDAYARYVLGASDLGAALERGRRAFALLQPVRRSCCARPTRTFSWVASPGWVPSSATGSSTTGRS